jgi:dipeptide/tripeptide permease
MFAGYIIMAVPGMTLTITIVGLFIIALGNGLFKGNLQAVVGQMYADPKYASLRDSAFMIFYMGINIGALFAPFASTGMRNWWLKTNGFIHDGSLPSLCHQFINGTLTDTATFQQLADKSNLSGHVTEGLMQGGWLLATAVGNKLLFVGTLLWDKVELWQLWLVFILCCLTSAAFIFSILKKLEKEGKG